MSDETPRTEPGSRPLPQGLPRRPRSAPPAPRLHGEAVEATGTDDDADDTLRPDALARAMTAIQRGSLRARLTAPDDTDGRRPPRPGPGAD